MAITRDLGIVTAYGYAVSKGYTGTEEEFAILMADYADVADIAEAWAVGTRAGVPVEEGDEAYHNNAKYYSDEAGEAAESAKGDADTAEAYAKGTVDGVPVEEGQPGYEDNAKFYAGEASDSAEAAAGSEQAAKDYADHIADPVSGLVTGWLDEHVDPETGYVIDDTLTVQGAAADAKATGDAVGDLKSALSDITLAATGVFTLLNAPNIVSGYAIKSAGNGVVADDSYDIYRFSVISYRGSRIHLDLNSHGGYCAASFTTGASLSSTFISKANDGDTIPNDAVFVHITTQAIQNDRVGIYYDAGEMVIHGDLKGKTIYACGDSITKGANNGDVSYIDKIANRNGMTLTNYAVSGSTIVKTILTEDPLVYRGCVLEQVETMVAQPNPDYAVISGGYNDSQSNILNPIGEVKPSNTYSAAQSAFVPPFDTSTVCGALEQILYNLNQLFPMVKILYVITYDIVAAYHWKSEYVPAIKSCLEKWGVPYVDLTTEGRLTNEVNLWQRNYIYTDGTHPNNYGYERIADIVEKKLKEL